MLTKNKRIGNALLDFLHQLSGAPGGVNNTLQPRVDRLAFHCQNPKYALMHAVSIGEDSDTIATSFRWPRSKPLSVFPMPTERSSLVVSAFDFCSTSLVSMSIRTASVYVPPVSNPRPIKSFTYWVCIPYPHCIWSLLGICVLRCSSAGIRHVLAEFPL